MFSPSVLSSELKDPDRLVELLRRAESLPWSKRDAYRVGLPTQLLLLRVLISSTDTRRENPDDDGISRIELIVLLTEYLYSAQCAS